MTWVLIIAAVVVFDAIVTTLLVWTLVKAGWQPLMSKYPAAEPAAEAVSKNFQSFRFGVLQFGHLVHVAVDEEHLHLRPAKVLRWCGAKSVSVPWEAIEVISRSRSGKWVNAKLGVTPIKGPAWCLELAGDEALSEGLSGNET